MDQTLGYLIQRLKETQLLNNMNIVIVSDHGKQKFVSDNIKLRKYYNC